ncbi:post-PEP-CTERM-1 domain-containing protein [Luteimonas lutimaris]|uniref:FTP domain-containing protein n=1 Tax=Luteimonas lutimaris TaxID=698645 RepID=A0ABP7N124_9GAMM|nr:hypothetical protein [Luteimonas sp.]
MQKKLMGAVAVAAVATLAASGAAMAAQPVSKAKPTTVVYQGVQVAIDPATGRLRAPNAVERRALSQALVRNQANSVRPLDETQARATFKRNRRTGMMSMQVPETQVSYLTAHRTDDGKIEVGHEDIAVDGAQATEVTP